MSQNSQENTCVGIWFVSGGAGAGYWASALYEPVIMYTYPPHLCLPGIADLIFLWKYSECDHGFV